VQQLLTLLSDTLAVYRLTKLITDDKITEDLRNLIFDKFPKGHKLRYLITCGWCVSIWAALAIFTLRKIHPETADFVSGILATSAVTGVAYSKGL
jgi:hypothetical protein